MLTHDVFISYSQAADGQFGAELQRAVERLARSWRRRRALRVFRDLTGLTASPVLWGSIVEAMDGAGWFVLLASPTAAESEWVGREIEHWVATKGTERLLVVVTDGTWAWDADRGDLDLARSSAAHPALQGVFRAEPRHMDLSWARTEDDLTLRNARFHEAVAELVAPMHGLTKDELVGEDVRQQRRTMRLVRGVVALLTVLTLAATGATGIAVASARDADRQRALAEEERQRAEEQARQSDSRRLAALSLDLQSQDGALSQLLAVQAYAVAPTDQARTALASAATYEGSEFVVPSTDGGRVHARLVGHEGRPVAASFAPDGALVATLDQRGTARLWDVDEPSSPTTISGTTGTDVAVSGSGETVAVATVGSSDCSTSTASCEVPPRCRRHVSPPPGRVRRRRPPRHRRPRRRRPGPGRGPGRRRGDEHPRGRLRRGLGDRRSCGGQRRDR